MKYQYQLAIFSLVVQPVSAYAFNLDCRSDDSPYRVEFTSDEGGRLNTGKVTKNNQNLQSGDLRCMLPKPFNYYTCSSPGHRANYEQYIAWVPNIDNPIIRLNFVTYDTSTIVAELPCWKS